tara:strand:- start:1829 stop:2263 length:435 start_codon:yes stop_codon:yes gene_type:complete
MGRWLKKLAETRGVPTDKADNAGPVSVVSTLPPHIQKKNADNYSKTRGVFTDKADKVSSVSVVSAVPPHIQKPQTPAVRVAQNPDDLLADIAAMLQVAPNQLRALLSANDLDDIADGYNSRAYMLDYFRLMRTDGLLPRGIGRH